MTLREPVRHELEVKRSRFIACLYPVTSSEQARDDITQLRKEFHDARHWPSAFVLGSSRIEARSNDDGEPAGTAGVPILQALLSYQSDIVQQDLSDVLAVVVRYFGGIKLGASGLTRTYGAATTEALTVARFTVRQRMELIDIHLPLADAGAIEATLRSSALLVTNTIWEATECIVQVAYPPELKSTVDDDIAALTSGIGKTSPAGTQWTDQLS